MRLLLHLRFLRLSGSHRITSHRIASHTSTVNTCMKEEGNRQKTRGGILRSSPLCFSILDIQPASQQLHRFSNGQEFTRTQQIPYPSFLLLLHHHHCERQPISKPSHHFHLTGYLTSPPSSSAVSYYLGLAQSPGGRSSTPFSAGVLEEGKKHGARRIRR